MMTSIILTLNQSTAMTSPKVTEGKSVKAEAQELIKKGIMTGSVLQDSYDLAKALYTVGVNLVYNRNPLYYTEYKFDQTGVSIRLPYKEYIMN